jgi:two-component system response regulator RegA
MKEQVVLKNINDFENKSLLIVDDDNPFRERLARAMEKKGFEVTQAESVQKGVDSVKAKKPGFCCSRFKTRGWQWTRSCKRNSKFK